MYRLPKKLQTTPQSSSLPTYTSIQLNGNNNSLKNCFITVTPPHPYINTIGITPEVPSTPDKKYNLQKFHVQLEQLLSTQTTDCHTNPYVEYYDPYPPQVKTKHKDTETTPHPLNRNSTLISTNSPLLPIHPPI